MEVRTLLKRGTDHPLNCEDDLFTFNDGSTYIGAVFDGCSTGIKSHFASTLYSKILADWCEKAGDSIAGDPIQEVGRNCFQYLFLQLDVVRKTLNLYYMEMLSTMILMVVRDGKAYILVSGDGCISLSSATGREETKIESPGNAPDYLAYHLACGLDAFRSLKEYTFNVEKTISICSDGIYSFTGKDKVDQSHEVMTSLLEDASLLKSEAMLGRKYNLLLKEGYSNYDDLSIVRFIV